VRRLGVLGGSFNPVHWGHLHIALLAAEAAGLDEVLFVPAARPPHKSGALAPAEDRLAMLRLALSDESGAGVSTIELAENGPRYTVDTLSALKAEHPDAQLAFIVGFDSLLEMPTWRDPERILAEHRVIGVDRPGVDGSSLDPDLARRVLLVEGNPLAISASQIRRRVAGGLSIRHLVPGPVEEYILAHGLYRAAAGAA
jgi:nicotinate-nucleotide adenylyltransferase